MLGFCRDPLVVELHNLGYSLISLPEARTSPLDCFARQGKELFRLGRLGDLFTAGKNGEPTITPNTDVAGLNITRSSMLDSGLGFAMLSQWIGNAKANISGTLKRSAKFSFEIKDVKKDSIDLKPLDDFLLSASLNFEGPTVQQMLEGDEIYVVTSILKARSLAVATASGGLIEPKVELPESMGLGVSVDAQLKIQRDSDNSLAFVANNDPLVFAFQAVQLCFHKGAYRSLRLERSKLQVMSDQGLGTTESAAETGWLCDRMGSTFPRFSPTTSN
jgi:hypothetical protein